MKRTSRQRRGDRRRAAVDAQAAFQAEALAQLARIADAVERLAGAAARPAGASPPRSWTCRECGNHVQGGINYYMHKPGCRLGAVQLPYPPKGQCAAGCGHWVPGHDERGCVRSECGCTAPSGRILPLGQPSREPLPDDMPIL